MARSYTDRTLKILWALSQGKCAHPNCDQACVVPSADGNDFVVVGQISHIYAYGKDGPRGNPKGLSETQLNDHSNLIVLCSNHHNIVDDEANVSIYTAEMLLDWKRQRESWVILETTKVLPDVTFQELDIVTKAILAKPAEPTLRFEVTAPLEKMRKNNLTDQTLLLMQHGYAKALEVGDFVTQMSIFDPSFPERLKAGFVAEYERLRDLGVSGDLLFTALHQFTYGKEIDFIKRAAGLAVLVYLFQKCEIFEP
jgi:hypothetical protein